MDIKNDDWSDSSIFPDVLNKSQNNFSVDVLVYLECLDQHSIAWFDFKGMCWLFLSNQDYHGRKFQWRYFNEKTDKIYLQNDGKNI